MKIILLTIVGFCLVFITGCATTGEISLSKNIQCKQDQVFKTSHLYFDTTKKIQREYARLEKLHGWEIENEAIVGKPEAFTIHNSKTDVYTLYLPKLNHYNDQETIEFWGHETAHVACGDWHPTNYHNF